MCEYLLSFLKSLQSYLLCLLSLYSVCVILVQVIHRLGVEAPKKSLVENYMIEIARNYKVDYEPDPSMFLVSSLTVILWSLLNHSNISFNFS